MPSPPRKLLPLAIAVLFYACNTPTESKSYDLTGFWSGKTTYSTGEFTSRMMIVQAGSSVSGWYRARAGIPTDETAFTGSVHGDTLSVLINSGQVILVGAVKFRILSGGANLSATNNGNTLNFALEK